MSLPTRRWFLNTSVGVAAAVSAGSALAADVKEQQGKRATTGPTTRSTKKQAKGDRLEPSDRINMAVIGCGDRGQNHVESMLSLSDHINIVALCDPDESRVAAKAQHVEEESGYAPKIYTDIRKLLEDKDVQAVSIATPNHWHSLASIWAIQAGKDVFVEKPLSHNIMEGRRVVEFARKHNRVVLHGTQSRSSKQMHQAMRFLHEGGLGKVFLARGLCYKKRPSLGQVGSDQPIPSSVNYDLWCGPAPMTPLHRKSLHYDWHWFWETGNGDIGNQGVHQMDICAWGLNKTELPTRVQCIGGRLGYEDDGETPNTQVAVLNYDDAEVIFEVRGLPSKPVPGAKAGVCNVFYGTEGTLVVNSYSDCTAYAPDGTKIKMPEYSDLSAPGNHFTQFIKSVRSRKLDYHNGDVLAGHVSSAMCHMANISYLLGEEVPFSAKKQAFGDDRAAYATLARLQEHLKDNKLTPEETEYMLGPALEFDATNEKFVGNDAANKMLSRDYREPFVVPDHVA
jgi:predicted dehydrogenase